MTHWALPPFRRNKCDSAWAARLCLAGTLRFRVLFVVVGLLAFCALLVSQQMQRVPKHAEPPARSARRLGGSGWGAGIALCGLLFLPLALVRRRRVLLLAALLAFLIFGISSCAGSGGGTGGSPEGGQGGSNAATGTFSIPVTVAANGVAHTVTLTTD